MNEYIFFNGSRIKNLKGSIYGFLEPLEIIGIKNKYAIWRCKCILCGKERDVSSKRLAQKSVTMCKECAKSKKIEQIDANRKGPLYNNADLSGKDFGFWRAKEKSGIKNGTQMYTCICKCGTIKDISVYSLINGTSTSCGCSRKEDIAGKEFGFLKAIKPVGSSPDGGILWECQCRCGTKVNVAVSDLHWRRSCGCMEGVEKEKHTKIVWAAKGGQKIRADNTSGVRGVKRANGKWGAFITFQKNFYWLGTYGKKEDAVKARRTAEEHLYKGFLEWYAKEYCKQQKD